MWKALLTKWNGFQYVFFSSHKSCNTQISSISPHPGHIPYLPLSDLSICSIYLYIYNPSKSRIWGPSHNLPDSFQNKQTFSKQKLPFQKPNLEYVSMGNDWTPIVQNEHFYLSGNFMKNITSLSNFDFGVRVMIEPTWSRFNRN